MKRWSEKEVELLKQKYCDCNNINELAKILNKSTISIYNKAKKLNLKKNNKSRSDLSKLTFDKLYVLEEKLPPQKYGKTLHRRWLCKCQCGKKKIVRGSNLLRGITHSCGCIRYDNINTSYGLTKVNKNYINHIKIQASRRNLAFDLDLEYLQNLYDEQHHICNLCGLEIYFEPKSRDKSKNQTASLDRIDSSKGYVRGNVQWVHKVINTMKWALDQNTFVKYCKLVANKNGNRE